LEIERVAWDMQRQDLPVPVARELVAEGIARNQDGAAIRFVTFPQSVGLCLEPAQLVRKSEHRRPIIPTERMMDIQLVREPLKRMWSGLIQRDSPAIGRERAYLSVANALDNYAASDFASITCADSGNHTNVK